MNFLEVMGCETIASND